MKLIHALQDNRDPNSLVSRFRVNGERENYLAEFYSRYFCETLPDWVEIKLAGRKKSKSLPIGMTAPRPVMTARRARSLEGTAHLCTGRPCERGPPGLRRSPGL